MSFREINVTNYIGAMSPQALSVALNGGGATITTHATALLDVGLVRALMPEGLARLIVHADSAYGSGESLIVSLQWQGADGTVNKTVLATLDATTVAAAGQFEFDRIAVTKIPPGSVVSLSVVYTAGTPNDPDITLALQLY